MSSSHSETTASTSAPKFDAQTVSEARAILSASNEGDELLIRLSGRRLLRGTVVETEIIHNCRYKGHPPERNILLTSGGGQHIWSITVEISADPSKPPSSHPRPTVTRTVVSEEISGSIPGHTEDRILDHHDEYLILDEGYVDGVLPLSP